MSSILLKNATVLVPRGGQGDDEVVPLRNHSLLIEGKKIVKIAPQVEPPSSSTEVIDCTGKLICPGFIDTHHHTWQTQLKGRHADHSLINYLPSGNMQSYNYAPEDVFWGQLGGCLEAINVGTTTMLDHAHMNYSPDHSPAAIAATVSSGIRSVFGYAPTPRVKEWKPLAMDYDMFPEWALKQIEELGRAAPFGDGRVTMALAYDLLFLGKDVTVDAFRRCREAGVNLVTIHSVSGGGYGNTSTVNTLESFGLLNSDIVLSHANNISEAEALKMQEAQAFVSATPFTELQMGHGWPACFRDDMKSICSLGVDCQSSNTASMVDQMRLTIQAERARRHDALLAQGKSARKLDTSVQDVFRLATIQGARAINRGDELGSLEEGKLADIVIFDALSPEMICAAEEDPVAAIVLHSSAGNVESVIVDGQFRKKDGRLVPTDVDLSTAPGLKVDAGSGSGSGSGSSSLAWRDVAAQLLASRERIRELEKKNGADDHDRIEDAAMAIYGFNPSNFV